MGIFRRVSDIISANFNDLVDRFEDPEAMLRQAIREMETAIDNCLDGAAKAIAEERLLARQLDDYRRSNERLHEKAAAAVKRGDDAAARSALTLRAEQEKLIAALDDQLQSSRRHSARLRNQVAAMRVRLAEARSKLQTCIARNRAAEARRQFAVDAVRVNHAGASYSRFDALCRKIERRESEADAYEELAGDLVFDTPPNDDIDITLELEALKEKVATGG
jgi:phage shock protein A